MAPITTTSMLSLLVSLLLLWDLSPASAAWQTLTGDPPFVIANGGLSGLYPDQSSTAYYEALYQSLPGVGISCDLQIAKSSNPQNPTLGAGGICRTGLDLSTSTNIAVAAPQFNTTRIVNGKNTTGFFAVDIPFTNLTSVARCTQSNFQRSPAFDGSDQLVSETSIPQIIQLAGAPFSYWWLNSENTRWIEENSNINATLYTTLAIQQFFPAFASVPEINLLKELNAAANITQNTVLIYKFLETATVDASTNQTYASLLKNLTYLSTIASGILVPKSYIWPIDPVTFYLSSPTTLVDDAHKAKLLVFVYGFANDELPGVDGIAYNYTFDPITEILYFVETYNFTVDGFFTDFPVTGSEAISCYAANSRNSSVQNTTSAKKPTIISHDGYSGKYPASTSLAYQGAIDANVDYIDCNVQISKDSVLFCRPTVNLLDSTDISGNNAYLPYLQAYPGLNDGAKGYYPFELTWDQISSLRAIIYSPDETSIPRDPNYNNQLEIITLAEFLAIAKNNSVGALIDIQNAVYLRQNQNLVVVDAVVAALSAAGYTVDDKVILESEDSAVLARLRELNITYPMMFQAIYTTTDPISLTSNDLAEIKTYASSVNFYARLVEPFDSNYFLASPPVDVIALAHAQNLTTYFSTQRNEFLALAFDFQSDPTLELYSLTNDGVDGFITDFPPTVQNYLVNHCLPNAKGLTANTLNYSIPLVTRGAVSKTTYKLPSPAPAPGYFPELVVPEPALAGPNSPSPAPIPASAPHISTPFYIAAVSMLTYVLLVV